MYFHGIILGVISFACIGVFHPIVIKSEYHFGAGIWPVFLLAGLLCLGISVMIADVLISATVGVIGFSCLWSIVELGAQKKRVEKGWFPENPKRHGRK